MKKKSFKTPVILDNPQVSAMYVVYLLVLYYLMRQVPDFTLLGVAGGAKIRMVAPLGPINGIVLGPVLGVIVTLVQTYLSVLVAGGLGSMAMGPLTILPMLSASLVAGLFVVRRPLVALSIPTALVVAWYATPVGRAAWTTPWFLVLAISVVYLYRYHVDIGMKQVDLRQPLPLFAIALLALLTDHMMGNLVAMQHYNLAAEAYNAVVLTYPGERLIMAGVSTIITLGLVNDRTMHLTERLIHLATPLGGSVKPAMKVEAGRDLPAYKTYLSTEEDNTKGLEIFAGMVKDGRWGLCITRTYPDIVREVHDLLNTPVIWLSEDEYEETGQWSHLNCDGYENKIDPTDVDRVETIVSEFIQRTDDSVVLLDGLDIIAEARGFNAAWKLLRDLHKLASSNNTRLIVSANPKELSEVELARLRSELEVILA